jgi:CRISPR-associated protein Cas1
LGIEGTAAREYFSNLTLMFKSEDERPDGARAPRFDFESRNRRPPRDPVNALLSFVYSLLLKDLVATLIGVGFDPYLGFYHQPRYGRPALALDLMEEFRPLVADSVVINLINNGELRKSDFISRAGAVGLTSDGRKRVIENYERRLDLEVTHPLFGYSISYRRIFEVQARLLGRFLTGEIPRYPAFCTR